MSGSSMFDSPMLAAHEHAAVSHVQKKSLEAAQCHLQG